MASKSPVRTDRAPAPFQGAPYSQAIRVGDLVFVSGQLPLRPGSAEVVGTTIQEQTEQVFKPPRIPHRPDREVAQWRLDPGVGPAVEQLLEELPGVARLKHEVAALAVWRPPRVPVVWRR